MGIYEVRKGNSHREFGRRIYMDALYGRRGFRDDQLGIEDESIWAEIFENIGRVAAGPVQPDALAEDVENCPFCGKDPLFCSITDVVDQFDHYFTISCAECGIEMTDEYKDGVVSAWNKRFGRAA